MALEYALVGWPEDGPTLELDHERFAYAGKFVMSTTGKAVAREPPAPGSDGEGGILAAVAFNADRTDGSTLWLRYITVRDDRRGGGIGARLAAFVYDRARACGYDRTRIAVNNAFAYHALWKAGFAYTGDRTGLAELVLERPGDRTRERYQAGLDAFRDRDTLAEEEAAFLAEKEDSGPPPVIPPPG